MRRARTSTPSFWANVPVTMAVFLSNFSSTFPASSQPKPPLVLMRTPVVSPPMAAMPVITCPLISSWMSPVGLSSAAVTKLTARAATTRPASLPRVRMVLSLCRDRASSDDYRDDPAAYQHCTARGNRVQSPLTQKETPDADDCHAALGREGPGRVRRAVPGAAVRAPVGDAAATGHCDDPRLAVLRRAGQLGDAGPVRPLPHRRRFRGREDGRTGGTHQ